MDVTKHSHFYIIAHTHNNTHLTLLKSSQLFFSKTIAVAATVGTSLAFLPLKHWKTNIHISYTAHILYSCLNKCRCCWWCINFIIIAVFQIAMSRKAQLNKKYEPRKYMEWNVKRKRKENQSSTQSQCKIIPTQKCSLTYRLFKEFHKLKSSLFMVMETLKLTVDVKDQNTYTHTPKHSVFIGSFVCVVWRQIHWTPLFFFSSSSFPWRRRKKNQEQKRQQKDSLNPKQIKRALRVHFLRSGTRYINMSVNWLLHFLVVIGIKKKTSLERRR